MVHNASQQLKDNKMNRKCEWAKAIVEDIGDGSFAKGSQVYRWATPKGKTGGSGGIPDHWVWIMLEWHTQEYPDKNYFNDIDLLKELIKPDHVQ